MEIQSRIFFDNVAWVVQGLNLDIAAQGASMPEAIESFKQTVLSQIALDIEVGIEPLTSISPAPYEYWTLNPEGAETYERSYYYFMVENGECYLAQILTRCRGIGWNGPAC